MRDDEEFQDFIAQRAMFGFRADEEYVRELIERDQWETETGVVPVTREEDAYLAKRNELERGPELDRYLAEHPHLDGGTSKEGRWPDTPYLLLRVTEDPAEHEARIKALARFPDQLRIVRVAHSKRDLEAITERISDDADALEREGFTVASVGADVGENAVVVELMTPRTDAGAIFGERYGPVKVDVIATETHSLVAATLTGYRVAGRELIVHYEKGGELVRVDLAGHDDRVEVAVIERVWNGPTAAVLIYAHASVELREPLGDRAVIDTATGRKLAVWRPRMIRTAVLTALATLAIAAPAAAADNLCHGQLAPPTPEQELQHHIEFAMELRAENGLRADEAYVRSLVEQGLPESDVIVGPVTPGEERYLKIRENLGLGRRAIHYLEQRPGLSGGSSITDRFPRKPLLVLHLTRDRATHQAALKRLVPRPRLFRTEKVRYSEHSLDRITRQIYRDRKKLRKAGSRSATPRRTPPRTASTSRSSRREPTTPSTSRTATGRSSPNARAPSSPSSCASRPASSGSRPTAGRCASPGSRRTPTRSRSASRSPSSTIASSSASSSASRPRSTPMAAARRSTRDR